MALTTTTGWTSENAKLAKRPLYIVTIENVLAYLTTFRPEDMEVTQTGYGIGGYGINGYGY
jgi:hypothetical protein